MTKWCKLDEFFKVSKHQLMEIIKKKKLCKEQINIIVPTNIEKLMFDDEPAVKSLSQSEIEQVKQLLLAYHNLNGTSTNVDTKRQYDGEGNDDNDENVSKKRCL